jgi:hypothetical protein
MNFSTMSFRIYKFNNISVAYTRHCDPKLFKCSIFQLIIFKDVVSLSSYTLGILKVEINFDAIVLFHEILTSIFYQSCSMCLHRSCILIVYNWFWLSIHSYNKIEDAKKMSNVIKQSKGISLVILEQTINHNCVQLFMMMICKSSFQQG